MKKSVIIFSFLTIQFQILFGQTVINNQYDPCSAGSISTSPLVFRMAVQNGISPNVYMPCGTEDNPVWWKFRAQGTSVSFTLTPSNCVSGSTAPGAIGTQITLFKGGSCVALTPVICDFISTPTTLTYTTSPNTLYYWHFDGYAECQCSFSIDFNSSQLAAVTLPIELTSFDAKAKDSETILFWNTASEQNNDYFNVVRSQDGVHFEAIGKVKGNGTSSKSNSYRFVDKQPFGGLNYYRLHQVDFDGSAENSKIISVRNDKNKDISIYPNPTDDNLVIYLPSSAKELSYNLYNLEGQTMLSQKNIDVLDKKQIELSIANLPKGIYILEISRDSKTQIMKVVKR